MSGGRLGNVAHMLIDVPEISEMNNIVIVAGANDIVQDSESAEDFVATIEKGLDQVQQHLFSRSTTSLTVVEPPWVPDASPLRQTKAAKLRRILNQSSVHPDFQFRLIAAPEVHMDGIHPTIEGTKELLQAIDKQLSIIHNPKFITTERRYQGVEAVFKYGCLHCPHYLELDRKYFCPHCAAVRAAAAGVSSDSGASAADKLIEAASIEFPKDTEPPPDFTMGDANKKRSIGESQLTDTPSKKPLNEQSSDGSN